MNPSGCCVVRFVPGVTRGTPQAKVPRLSAFMLPALLSVCLGCLTYPVASLVLGNLTVISNALPSLALEFVAWYVFVSMCGPAVVLLVCSQPSNSCVRC